MALVVPAPLGIALDQAPALDENLLPRLPTSPPLNKKVPEDLTGQAHTNFLNTTVAGSSLGSLEPRTLPANTLGAPGFAPKLFLAQVRPDFFKDLTQMSPESPKLGLVIPASLLLGHLARARNRAEPSSLAFHPYLLPPAYT